MRRALNRVAAVTAVVFGLSVAVPPGAVPSEGDFPLSWLWSWAEVNPAYSVARAMVGLPVQKRGPRDFDTRPASAAATDAHAGAGRAPKPAKNTLTQYQPYTPVTPKTSLDSVDPSFDARTSKRLAAKSTAQSDVYQNKDGSLTRRAFSSAQNFRAGDGTWKPIDTDLVRKSDGRLHTKANSLDVSVAGTAPETAEAEQAPDDLATIALSPGESVGYTLDGAQPVAAVIDDSTATYRQILPQTDLELEAVEIGLKETLVLRAPGAVSSWIFPLRLKGLTPKLTASGEIQLVDKTGKVKARIPKGFMVDSKIDPVSKQATRSEGVTYRLIEQDGAPALQVDADRAWLLDPARVYPVRVDPSVETVDNGDVFVDNDSSTTNQNGLFLPVGTNNGTIKNRSFLHFGEFLTVDAGVVENKKITSAKLKLFLTYAKCNVNLPFSVHRATEAWSVANLTNGSFPGPAISAPIGTLTVSNPTAACTNTAAGDAINGIGDRNKGVWVTVTLDPTTFNDWSSNAPSNLGLALTASETDASGYKLFDSSNTGVDHRPVLQLTYAPNVAPQINARYPGNNAVAPSLTPELMVRGYDADAYPNKGLKYVFTVYDSDGNEIVDSGTNPISSPTWSVPAGKLAWNKTYLWGAEVTDLIDDGPDLPLWAFNTAPPQPALTSGLSQNSGKGYDASIGNYTTSATDATIATVGPSLEITRSYNSLDTRRANAFGTGWASVLDMRATSQPGAASGLQNMVITYPTGQELAFGRNADGTFAPASGRFATLTETKNGTTVTGYTLTDKDATVYAFNQAVAGGIYRISSITDANDRTLTVEYGGDGNPYKMTGASGRALMINWATPSGSSVPHVATIATEPIVAGDWNTAATWQYSYGPDDQLVKVCSPLDWAKCWQYEYTSVSQHANTVMNTGPMSYWPFNETSGTIAKSAALTNSGIDAARYTNVTLGQPSGIAGSSGTAAGFNGTSSFVQLPSGLIADGQYQSVSMWFKTTTAGGVLFSYNQDPLTNATTPHDYTPALYIDKFGKLRGEFWTGQAHPINSNVVVTDGAWHHVALAGAGSSQTLYLDAVARGTLNEPIARFTADSANNVNIGGGFVGHSWPDHVNTGNVPGVANFFKGSISDVGFFNQSLSPAAVTALRQSGVSAHPVLTKVIRPSGGVTAKVTYDQKTGKVATVTDENNGTWTMGTPEVVGSGEVYAASVLGARPKDYWRLGETGTSAAINQVDGETAGYSDVTLGGTGPFAGSHSASFNGTSSYVTLPATDTPAGGSGSIEMWFNQTKDNTAGGVLYSYQTAAMTELDQAASWVPGLYVGTDGKLRGGYWAGSGFAPITSTGKVNDGGWHHVALSTNGSVQSLYLDGALVGSQTASPVNTGATNVQLGAGKWVSWPGVGPATAGYFPGSIAEVAYYGSELTAQQVAARQEASQQTIPVAVTVTNGDVKPIVMPVSKVTVTGPSGEKLSYSYDVMNGNRMVAQTDALGNQTKFGYDVGGFSSLVYDPRGIWTQNLQDVRGNTKQTISCQDQSADVCSSVYYTYFPDATTTTLTPDARNDLLLSVRDGRSSSATDDTYVTTYGYDTHGNQTTVKDALGRVTTTGFTDSTTEAVDGGTVPAGLPTTIVTAGGTKQTVRYFASGDMAELTDPVGKVVTFGYDGIGRLLTETEYTDTYPNGLVTSHSYDSLGREVTVTTPAVTNRVTGAVHTSRTTMTYDVDGNVLESKEEDLTGGDAPRTEKHTFDAFGRERTATTEGGAVSTYDYDTYGRIVLESGAAGDVTRNAYDLEGNLLTTTLVGFTGDPNNPESAHDVVVSGRSYDPAGQLATETDAMGWTTSYTYYDNGLEAGQIRSDGTDSFQTSWNSFDAAGNMVRSMTNHWATKVEMSYDAAGRMVSSTADPDGLHRKTSATYDRDDNVVATTQRDASGSTVGRTDSLYNATGDPLAETTYTSNDLTPVDRWKLTETTGTRAADSVGNNPGTAASGVTWSTERGGSAMFNGSSAGIVGDSPAVDTTRSFSVSAWVKLTNKGRNRTVVAQDGDRVSALNLQYQGWSDRWTLNMPSEDTDDWYGRQATSTSVPQLNTWTHLTGVFDAAAAEMKIYVNGTLEDTAPLEDSTWSARGPLTIGSSKWMGNPADPWQGGISDVQVYQQTLDATQVGQIKAATAPSASAKVIRTSYAYDQDGEVISSTDPNGNTSYFTYDEAGQAVKATAPAALAETSGAAAVTANAVAWTGYNTFGEPTDDKDPNGNWSVTVYDAEGRPVSEKSPSYLAPGTSTAVTPEVVSSYDTSGRLAKIRDPLGKETSYVYDQLDRVASVKTADQAVTKYSYDLLGDVVSTTDPTGAVNTMTWDYLGRKRTSTDVVRQTGSNYTTSYEYGYGGWLSKETSPGNVSTSTEYNSLGETVKVIDGANNPTNYTYDSVGRLARVTLPDSTYTKTAYDLADRPVKVSAHQADNTELKSNSTEYDAAGNMVASTDGRGTVTKFSYDVTGMLIRETQPISASDTIETTFGYDLAGNRTRFTDGRGNAFWTTYNSLGLPESQIEPSTTAHPQAADRTFTVAYDAAGRAVKQTLPGGVTTTNEYDVLGQLKRQTGAGAEVATTARDFDYDLAGRLKSFSGATGTNTLQYDDRDLPTSITGPSGDTTFEYNPDGAVTKRTDVVGPTTFDYDSAGRLSRLTNTGAEIKQSYTYNNLSQVDKITFGTTAAHRKFTYDSLHRLTDDELRSEAGGSVAKIHYDWNNNDDLTGKTTTGFAGAAANTYTYDLADRLTSWNNGAATTAYAYDKAGNRVQNGTKLFTYDQRNRLLTADGSTYAYTARGTLKTAGTNTTSTDAFGQVITQTGSGTSGEYKYDALGRAIKTGFAYSGLGNDLAADGTSNYVRGPSGELVGEASGGVNRFAWTDLHSDVVGQFRTNSTTLPGSVTYDPLGKVTATSGLLGSLGYQSEWTESSTGRVNMHARWFNTDTGQFDTRDTASNNPAPDSINANRYQYGDANPLTVTDPTGHWGFKSVFKAVTSTVTSAVSTVSSYASSAYSSASYYAQSTVKAVTTKVKAVGKKVVKKVVKAAKTTVAHVNKARKAITKKYNQVKKQVKKKIKQGRKLIADKVAKVKKKIKAKIAKVKQIGSKIKAKAVRTVKKAAGAVKDAAAATKKWAAEHKDAIIEVAAIGGAILAGMACTAVTGGVGAVACMAGTSALINLTKDVAQGDIHSVGDALGSLGTGAATGLVGGASGLAAGKVSALVGSKVGTGIAGRMVTEATENGIDEIVSQGLTTGRVDVKSALQSIVPGAGALKRKTKGKGATPAGGGGGGGGGGGPRCPTHSFEPDTKVLMADGSARPIEDVNVGDKVKATDPQTGKSTSEPVTQLHRNTDRKFSDVTVKDQNGKASVLNTTQNHPFWNETNKKWSDAKDLKPGDELKVAGQGEVVVNKVRNYNDTKEMRDLTVANIHTYYVVAGQRPVLVHNNDPVCDIPTLKGYARQIREAGDSPQAVERRVIAVGQDAAGNLTVGSSNGLDRGMKAMAKKLNIRPVRNTAGNHAEEDLMLDNQSLLDPPLKRVASDNQGACGVDRHNCAGQMDNLGIEHN